MRYSFLLKPYSLEFRQVINYLRKVTTKINSALSVDRLRLMTLDSWQLDIYFLLARGLSISDSMTLLKVWFAKASQGKKIRANSDNLNWPNDVYVYITAQTFLRNATGKR